MTASAHIGVFDPPAPAGGAEIGAAAAVDVLVDVVVALDVVVLEVVDVVLVDAARTLTVSRAVVVAFVLAEAESDRVTVFTTLGIAALPALTTTETEATWPDDVSVGVPVHVTTPPATEHENEGPPAVTYDRPV
ncbi:MAG TPA: hypothetical protein VFO60_11710, partial [Candidatus Dormibacteraeota bacterium]|nr:hypothetical protein [Candidatus Dormibacteraeota bacterium]